MWYSKDPFTRVISIQNFQFVQIYDFWRLSVWIRQIYISTPQHVVDHSRPASGSLNLAFFLCVVIVLKLETL